MNMGYLPVPGVGRPDVDGEEMVAPSVVPNYLPPESVSPKTLPLERMKSLEDDHDLGRLLEKMVKASGMTIPQIAQAMGGTRQTIYNIRKGRRHHATMQWFLRLCAVTGARMYIALPRK